MLVNAKDMLDAAVSGHYTVGQFNINNFEWVKAILTAAKEARSPVILGATDAAVKYMTGYKPVADLVRAMVESMEVDVPVALHYDHGTYEGCLACIDAGFTSVMFDGSKFSIEENVKKTKEIIDLCAKKGISMEAEVGSIAGEEDGITGKGECADPAQCKMIADLGVTMLAAGIGNIHGTYPDNWQGLSFETLAKIKELTGDLPLVLHGGTGIPDDMIKKAISLGVAKINVNTECQQAFSAALSEYYGAGLDQEEKGYNLQTIMKPATAAIVAKVKEKMELFGSVGKA